MALTSIIDTADNVTAKLSQLKREGINTIIRYDCRLSSGSWKQIYPNEAKAIADAGMRLGIVYEDRGATPSSFSEKTGYLSAAYSRKMAKDRGQPDRSAVYFAVDYDATPSDVSERIIPYFLGVYRAFEENNELPKLRVGVYGSGYVAQRLKARLPDILVWITCSMGFSGSRAAVNNGNYDLWQVKCDTTLLGVDCDFDKANTTDWGDFVPFGAKEEPVEPVHDVKWLQGQLGLEVDGIIGPKTIAAMIRVLELLQGGKV